MKINHIGYAVKRIDRAMKEFEKLGYAFGTITEDKDRNVLITFGEKDGYRIELVSPTPPQKKRELLATDGGTQSSPVDGYLQKTVGTPYHICYETDDLELEIEKLKGHGFKVIDEPKSAIAFDGRRVVFLMNLGFGLMEIVER